MCQPPCFFFRFTTLYRFVPCTISQVVQATEYPMYVKIMQKKVREKKAREAALRRAAQEKEAREKAEQEKKAREALKKP